jgi:Zn-finger nucleic acid-binding protein
MNCPGCGAAMRLDDMKGCMECEFCGSIKVLEPDADGVALLGTPSAMKCPVCKTALEEAAVHGRRLLCCQTCRGLLVGMDTFVGLVEMLRGERKGAPEAPHRFDPKDLDRRLECPQCGARMDTHPYAGPGNVAITTCEFCHLDWLDHGALRHVVAAPDDVPWVE